jgi:23S rRNA pseudouridine1911/1915/1917 synthase
MVIAKNVLHTLPPIEGREGVDYFFHVQPAEAQQRLDAYLVHHVPEFSRSVFAKLIRKGLVRVDGKPVKAGYCLRAGEAIAVTLERDESSQVVPQPVDFTIIHEDVSVLVVAKPPGLVVHPGAGREGSTLAHGLLYHCATLPGLEEQRPGIVHRLDKDTSGIMLVAKTEHALR